MRQLKLPPDKTQANKKVGHEGLKINTQLTPREWWCFSAAEATQED